MASLALRPYIVPFRGLCRLVNEAPTIDSGRRTVARPKTGVKQLKDSAAGECRSSRKEAEEGKSTEERVKGEHDDIMVAIDILNHSIHQLRLLDRQCYQTLTVWQRKLEPS
jgi:hypothetical protein